MLLASLFVPQPVNPAITKIALVKDKVIAFAFLAAGMSHPPMGYGFGHKDRMRFCAHWYPERIWNLHFWWPDLIQLPALDEKQKKDAATSAAPLDQSSIFRRVFR